MDRSLQISLLEELQGLAEHGHFFLDPAVQPSPVSRYASEQVFEAEMRDVFRQAPLIAAHASELPEKGSFLIMDLAGLPVLLTRDREGQVHAFLNVCRHRGARLVGAESGCKHAFSCPYHAWTWSNTGVLRGIPHQRDGFPDLDRTALGLRCLPAVERLGLIWVVAHPGAEPDFDAHLAPLVADFDWLDMSDLGVAASTTITRRSNWKLLIEGGIEAYHFKVTHRDTIGPHFLDNLSSYAMLGAGHMRSILPRNSLCDLPSAAADDWQIRDHANVLYTVFPSNQFLAMQDHIGWIAMRPVGVAETELRITTLAPRLEITEAKADHWARNHAITEMTLDEDFSVNEAVQAGLVSGANDYLTFGRYEGALHAFNTEVERRLTN